MTACPPIKTSSPISTSSPSKSPGASSEGKRGAAAITARILTPPTRCTLFSRHRSSEDVQNVGGFVLHLVVGEAKRGEPGGGVDLEPECIARLRRGRAVVPPAVGLDDEAEVGPEEVDLELVDNDFRLWRRQAGCFGQRAKEPFQLVVGEPKGVLVEDPAQRADASLARVVVKRVTQRLGVDHVALIRLVDRPLEISRAHHGDEVEEGSNRSGEGDAKTTGHL